MNEVVKVGMADVQTIVAPLKLRTSGLGSCVGIVLYDSLKKVAGMAHIMLPDSKQARQMVPNRAKYADTAIDDLVETMLNMGASRQFIKAKLAGGAQMFSFAGSSNLMRIGPRNTEAVKEKLKELHIPIVSEDIGGKSGRTIEFDSVTQLLHIRTVHEGTKDI
ncbi:chemotaxis protein CheD [Alkalihalobacillus pseudalcaliphilus]|uniref:chemotaxis protein CheD n=1 Tax=Alkalihalobacillus pseudalcaliphilus TaxID=79884 RepID=UPI00064DD6EE|nr:chemotaxis protein CheD [Alkalihalobacillus pseudalcaliphilus]KMK77235.1 chemotaxis protein CheD [Alkalihalobacillus pseudalcaliphilus]